MYSEIMVHGISLYIYIYICLVCTYIHCIIMLYHITSYRIMSVLTSDHVNSTRIISCFLASCISKMILKYPVVNQHNYGKSQCLMGKSKINGILKYTAYQPTTGGPDPSLDVQRWISKSAAEPKATWAWNPFGVEQQKHMGVDGRSPIYSWMVYFMENLTRNWIRILGYPHEILEISMCLFLMFSMFVV